MSDFLSARLGLPYLVTGQAQKDVTHNEALALIDIAVAASVLSMDLASPPDMPDDGDCWIVAEPAAGDWADAAGQIACRVSGGWRFLRPVAGLRVWVADRALWAQWDGADWSIGVERAAEIRIAGEPVVGARQPGVALPDGGATIDGEAREAIAAIIDRLRAHGLIG
jgi:hypothetical protein